MAGNPNISNENAAIARIFFTLFIVISLFLVLKAMMWPLLDMVNSKGCAIPNQNGEEK